MKPRDMELIRTILFKIEEEYQPDALVPLSLEIDGYEWSIISEHVRLLAESNYVEATDTDRGPFPIRLTMKGYDFLESIRNETVWNTVKSQVKEKGGSATLEIVKALAVQALTHLFMGASGS
jgi:Hypothetical protein (DUF2513)